MQLKIGHFDTHLIEFQDSNISVLILPLQIFEQTVATILGGRQLFDYEVSGDNINELSAQSMALLVDLQLIAKLQPRTLQFNLTLAGTVHSGPVKRLRH